MKFSSVPATFVCTVALLLIGIMVTRGVDAADAAVGPRLGKYNMLSYGAVGNPPLFLGHIELQAGGKYRISRKREGDYYGEGTYTFDATAGAVKWLSGPCNDDGWSGTFTIERDGKTHKIRLRNDRDEHGGMRRGADIAS